MIDEATLNRIRQTDRLCQQTRYEADLIDGSIAVDDRHLLLQYIDELLAAARKAQPNAS